MANFDYLGSALLLPLCTSSALVLAALVQVTAVGLNGVNPLEHERDVGIDNGGNWIGNLKRCYETENDVCTTRYGNYTLISG